MSADPSSNDLAPDGRSAEHLPYGVDTIVIPFTWSGPHWRRLPVQGVGGYEWVKGPYPPDHVGQGYDVLEQQREWALEDARQTSTELALSALETLCRDSINFRSRGAGTVAAGDAGNGSPDSGANNGVTVPDQTAAAAASSPPSGASPPISAGLATPAEAGGAARAAAANADKSKDPTAPVPVVDDQGKPVLIPQGPYKGQQMLRPATLDPHFFVKQGVRDKSRYAALNAVANLHGDGVALARLSRELMQLYKFKQGGEWDAQRVGGKYHPEYVDYATVAIGLYAASVGMSRDEILRFQDVYAAANSHFGPNIEMDRTYTHLPARNVANTDLGFQLYEAGRVRAAAGP